jgi:diadenosine tetraphosphate (Ap4A) HIT family hydrolase
MVIQPESGIKKPFDIEGYTQRVQSGPCFVCALVARHPDQPRQPFVYEDDDTIAFLTRYPTLWGYSLVAPKRHVEQLAADLDIGEYLRIQTVVYQVAKAVSAVVPTERVYVLSLGSQQGNAHLHWHVAPLPPGIPYHQQQFHAVMAENGVFYPSPAESEALAAAIRLQIASSLAT